MTSSNPNYNKNSHQHHGFFSSFINTLVDIFSDIGIVMMLVIAPVVYGFFYPWPYNSEVVHKVPVAVVDYDHSRLSNTLVRYANTNPRLAVQVVDNEKKAKQEIWQQHIAGYMIIPQGLEDKVSQGKLAKVSVSGNGGYFLLNKNVMLGFSEAVGTVSAGIEIKKDIAHGQYYQSALTSTQKIKLNILPLFNPTEGYGAYVVPSVTMLIIQQIILMGSGMLVGTWFEKNRHHASLSGWCGRVASISLIAMLIACFYYGWVFTSHDYTSGQNLGGSLLFLLIYCPTIASLGCLIGMILRGRERSLQLLIFSSLPMFFLSGLPYPTPMIPEPLQYLAMLLPSSYGIHASLQLNQMGASISQVSDLLIHLLILLVIYFSLLIACAYYFYHKKPIKTIINKDNR
ncbi:MAG: ABC transporter permease [Moraxellaceae bacterium]|nr:ABC transporter permease [Moraxellaceae bacterium]